jgi:hypothetical protein
MKDGNPKMPHVSVPRSYEVWAYAFKGFLTAMPLGGKWLKSSFFNPHSMRQEDFEGRMGSGISMAEPHCPQWCNVL